MIPLEGVPALVGVVGFSAPPCEPLAPAHKARQGSKSPAVKKKKDLHRPSKVLVGKLYQCVTSLQPTVEPPSASIIPTETHLGRQL